MTGLLQSGTGIGSGISLPSDASGLFELCLAAEVRLAGEADERFAANATAAGREGAVGLETADERGRLLREPAADLRRLFGLWVMVAAGSADVLEGTDRALVDAVVAVGEPADEVPVLPPTGAAATGALGVGTSIGWLGVLGAGVVTGGAGAGACTETPTSGVVTLTPGSVTLIEGSDTSIGFEVSAVDPPSRGSWIAIAWALVLTGSEARSSAADRGTASVAALADRATAAASARAFTYGPSKGARWCRARR